MRELFLWWVLRLGLLGGEQGVVHDGLEFAQALLEGFERALIFLLSGEVLHFERIGDQIIKTVALDYRVEDEFEVSLDDHTLLVFAVSAIDGGVVFLRGALEEGEQAFEVNVIGDGGAGEFQSCWHDILKVDGGFDAVSFGDAGT